MKETASPMIKEKLMKALKMAVADYNDGMSANASVVKAASEADFNVKQADRLVEMFNTLATLNKEKDAADPTGSCELANKKVVSRMLLESGGVQKAADCRLEKSSAYSFYNDCPDKTNKRLSAVCAGMATLVKHACDKEDCPDDLDVSQSSLFKRITSKIDLLKTACEAADDVVRSLRLEVDRNVVKVANELESSITKADIVDLFKVACDAQHAVKEISTYSKRLSESDGGRYAKAVVYDDSNVQDLLKTAAEIEQYLLDIPKYEKKRDFYRDKAAEAESVMCQIVGLIPPASTKPTMADFFKVAAVSDALSDIPKLMSPGQSATGNSMGVIDADRQQMLNARREMILSDLMANDPIIRDADPNEVVDIYKTIVMTAPRVSLDKSQVRSALRTAVNSISVSPNDAKVWADVDKGVALSNVSRITNIDSSIKHSYLG